MNTKIHYTLKVTIENSEPHTPLFSILCPTRNRPENVKKFITSIRESCDNFNDLEILFYVDCDDLTFPEDVLSFNIKKIVGNRMWLPIINNILYSYSSGQIIMYAGDDLVFKTDGWDTIVKNTFNLYQDHIVLVHVNDNAYQSKLATHGFVHKKWVEALGYFHYPGRTSSPDRWLTEVADGIGRKVYIRDLLIEHVHHRQGAASAETDEVYQEKDFLYSVWPWYVSYKKLKCERRADIIILTDHMNSKPKLNYNYLIGELLVKFQQKFGFSFGNSRRLRSMNNFQIIPKIFSNLIKKL
jgi:glycosyltransferase involved in cell wall biosynthesis